jgi:hypothetical protein
VDDYLRNISGESGFQEPSGIGKNPRFSKAGSVAVLRLKSVELPTVFLFRTNCNR